MMRPMLDLAFGFLLALAVTVHAAPVATGDGPVEGIAKSGVTQFLGIPYAAPPVGALRWMPPRAPAKWTAVRQTTKFGPTCAQVTTLGPFAGPANSNEDCLYLNVFTPDAAKKLPVLVWIHGGGYIDGESNDYDATRLAAKGKLVVVTLNYRLNLFGFLAHPALDAEGHAFGNYGILDMQAALRWVKANITAFGGDPGNVTLGGQSAGAGAAAANVVSPDAAGLFHRAIFQSGGYTPFASRALAEERGEKFAAAAGCSGKDVTRCLRALPATKVAALAGTASAFAGAPMVDGKVIPLQIVDAVRAGEINKMPIIMGTTRDEGNFNAGIAQYFKKDRAALTEADYHGYVTKSVGGNAGPGGSLPAYPKSTVDAVLTRYQPDKLGGAQMAWDTAHSDQIACRGNYMAPVLARHVPVYMYLFDDRTAPSYFPVMNGYKPLAYHTSDLLYLFTGFHGGPEGVPAPLNGKQQALSDRMIAAWADFARSGNPNGAGDAPWPRWRKNGPAYLLQDNAWSHTQTDAAFAAAHQCGFWNSILLYR
jgi:para-nitrobenzyl esterase